MQIYIYTLSDPRTLEVKYVGKTNDLKRRLKEHLGSKKKSLCSNWIKSLKKLRLKPTLEEVDTVSDNWQFWEQYYISLFKSWKFDLKNHTLGGEGTAGIKYSEEVNKNKRKPKTLRNKIVKDFLILNSNNSYDSLPDLLKVLPIEYNLEQLRGMINNLKKYSLPFPEIKQKHKKTKVKKIFQYNINKELIKVWDDFRDIPTESESNLRAACLAGGFTENCFWHYEGSGLKNYSTKRFLK